MVEPTLDELMQDILEIVAYPVRERGEFTAEELHERSGMSVTYEVFRNMLDRKVSAGELSKRWALVDGGKRVVYKKAE